MIQQINLIMYTYTVPHSILPFWHSRKTSCEQPILLCEYNLGSFRTMVTSTLLKMSMDVICFTSSALLEDRKDFITARNEVGTRLYFHRRLWFCPHGRGHAWLVGGRACMVARGHAWLLGGHAWLLGEGACMVGGGHAWLAGGACVVGRGVGMGVHGCQGACVVAWLRGGRA